MTVFDVAETKHGSGLVFITALLLGAIAAAFSFRDALYFMYVQFSTREEYSHGFLIPLLSAFLVYQRSSAIRNLAARSSAFGVVVVLLAAALFGLGELATLQPVIGYAFVLTVHGFALALCGWRVYRLLFIPLLLLFFMIPLPQFFYNNLSSDLQLISSKIGVSVIRLFEIPVYLEGNVIDLGSYKLQVVDACSGLRYLFPLMTLGFIMAYFYQAALWKRAVVFFSTIPITILMNSFRIGVIGVTVEHFGVGAAEGFLHDFEGWVVFMACFAVLFLEMRLLMLVTGDRRPLNHVFGITFPEPLPKGTPTVPRKVPLTGWVATGILVATAIGSVALPERSELIPERADFFDYPLEIEGWTGQPDPMEQQFIDVLKFTDYFMGNYSNPEVPGRPINWYIAYYDSQRKGQSAHSPRSCIPGGGWRITDLSQRTVEGVTVAGKPLRVNRVLISYGDNHQVVYYWFQQRGRVITNEYLVKWYLFWDALTRNRTDGALVRLSTAYIEGQQDPAEVDARLQAFLRKAVPTLEAYVPN